MIGPLPYIGGKRRLASQIIALMPSHLTYVEPFAGGAQVFFHKRPSRVEVLNDLDGEIVNFLRVCREHPQELTRTLRHLVPSRSLFAQFASQQPATLTDVQRAARLLYLQKNAFGGLVRKQTFHYTVTKPSNFNPARLPGIIAAVSERLQRVQLEQLPYEQVLAKYDRPSTLFYLDPPYVGVQLYRHNLADNAYEQLAGRLGKLRGRFILSINDCALSRHVFADFHYRSVSVAYTAHPSVPVVSELLYANFPLPA